MYGTLCTYIIITTDMHTEALLISFCARRNAIECQFNCVFSWDPHLSVQCVCGVYLRHICVMIVVSRAKILSDGGVQDS